MKKLFFLLSVLIIFLSTSCTTEDDCEVMVQEIYASMNYMSVYNVTEYSADVSANIYISSNEPQIIKMYLYGGGGIEPIQAFEYVTTGSEFQITETLQGLSPFHAYELRFFLNDYLDVGDSFYFKEFATLNNPSVDFTNLPINDMVFVQSTGFVYATIPSSYGQNGNSVAIINPETQEITFLPVGPEPTVIRTNNTEDYLYVSCGTQVYQINVNSNSVNVLFNVALDSDWPLVIEDMAIYPNQNIVAVSLMTTGGASNFEAVVIYDNGIQRPDIIGDDFSENDAHTITFIGTNLWGYNNKSTAFELSLYDLYSQGIEEMDEYQNVISGFYLTLTSYGDYLFTEKGHIVEVAGEEIEQAITINGEFSGKDMTIDQENELIIYLKNDDNSILRYDLNNYTLFDEFEIQDKEGDLEQVVCTGESSYVLSTDENELIFLNL